MGESIEVGVGIRNAAFKKGLDEMRGQAQKFSMNLGAMFAGAAAAFSFAAAIDKAGEIAALSKKFGTSAEDIQKLGASAKASGIDMEQAAKGGFKAYMEGQKALSGDQAAIKTFEKLGITAKQISAMTGPRDMLLAVADAVHGASDQHEAMAASVSLVGEKQAGLIQMFKKGGDAMRQQGDAALIMSNGTVASLDKAGKSIGSMKNQLVIAAGELLGNFSPAIVTIIEKLERFSLIMRQGASNLEVFYKTGSLSAVADNAVDFDENMRQLKVRQERQRIDQMTPEERKAGFKSFEPENMLFVKLKEKEKKPQGDDVDFKEKFDSENELDRLRKEIAEAARKERLDALDDEARLQAMYADRNALLAKANDTTKEGLEARKQAIDIERQAGDLSEKIADKAFENGKKRAELKRKHSEALAESLGKEDEASEKRRFNALKTPEEKAEFLTAKRDNLVREANALNKQPGKQLEASQKRLEAGAVQDELLALTDKSNKRDHAPSVLASSLREVGGGGRAMVTGGDQVKDEAKQIKKILEDIRAGLNGGPAPRKKTPASVGGLQNHALS